MSDHVPLDDRGLAHQEHVDNLREAIAAAPTERIAAATWIVAVSDEAGNINLQMQRLGRNTAIVAGLSELLLTSFQESIDDPRDSLAADLRSALEEVAYLAREQLKAELKAMP